MSHYASDSDNTNGRCRIVLTGGPGGGKNDGCMVAQLHVNAE